MLRLVNFLKSHFYIAIVFVVILSGLLVAFATPALLSFVYAVGLSTKEFILFLLPLLIFGCGFRCVAQLKNESVRLLLLLIGFIVSSNFIASWAGFSAVHWAPIHFDLSTTIEHHTLATLWEFTLYKPIPTPVALLLGILAAILLRTFPIKNSAFLSEKVNQFTQGLLNFALLPLLPFFMLGFLVKMLYEGSLSIIFQQYFTLAIILLISYSTYLFILFLSVSGFNIKKTLRFLWNLTPAGWLGFTTLSGLAALPLSIQCSEKNIRHKVLAGGILPLSSNIHLVGESLTLTILACMVHAIYFGTLPSLMAFSQYAFMWAAYAFSIAAVPAGSIIVMIPVLKSVLGFTPEMIAFTTLIYLFIEPLSTIVNIMGNGFLVILMDKVCGRKILSKQAAQFPQKEIEAAEI